MQLHHLSFPFTPQTPPCTRQFARLLALLDSLPELGSAACRRTLVYGMGLAGQAVYNHLVASGLAGEVLAFDRRGPTACEQVPVRCASTLGDCLPSKTPARRSLVINTAPPRHAVDVIDAIENALPDAVVVQWFDPFGYVDDAHDGYDVYFETLQPRTTSAARELADSLRARYLAGAERRHGATTAGLPPEALAGLLREAGCDLGTLLNRALTDILSSCAHGEEPVDGAVARLQDLAIRFPFFTIALDAAACLLVRHGEPGRALEAFAPAASRHPHCHRTLVRLAELHVLTGKRDQARQLCARAAPLAAAGSQLRRDCLALPDRPVAVLERQWRARPLRPPRTPRVVTLHCATPVWGREYLDLFMRVTLRSLFAPGNLPHAAARTAVRYTVYTGEQDAPRLRDYPEWRLLQELVDVRVELIEPLMARQGTGCGNLYDRMSRCQDHALQTSRELGMVTFFPLADLLFSARFLQRGLDLLDEGFDTIFFAGMRHSLEQMLHCAVPRFTQDLRLVAEARELYAHAAEAVHPVYQAKMRGEDVEMHPNSFFARDRQGNILQQFFAPTPMFIAPTAAPVSIASTLDADLGYSVADGGLGHFHYVTDTDEMLLLELTSDHARTGELRAPGPWSQAATADWIRHSIDPLNKLLGAHTVLLRREEGPRLSAEALRLAQHVYGLLL